MEGPEYRAYWEQGIRWADWLTEHVHANEDIWRHTYVRSKAPYDLIEEQHLPDACVRMLVIAEDWCGDASNSIPHLARLADSRPRLELRILKRDEVPELMDRFLTNGSRSIPMVLLLAEDYRLVGVWGPRPTELQAFVLGEKARGEREIGEIYKETRRWYARDRGRTTVREVIRKLAS